MVYPTQSNSGRKGAYVKTVKLAQYGGVIQNFLAEILMKRRKDKDSFLEQPENIPPRDFFSHLAEHPLPEVEGNGELAMKANEVIRFINRTDDILNLKRGLLLLLRLGGNTRHCLFSEDRYNPDLFDMEETEE